jgi:diamine N-acetyltransferase
MTSGPDIVLRPVDAANWRAVADVAPHPDQARWVAPVTRYLCLCLYDGEWQPLAVSVDDEVVGFVMWGLDEEEGSHYIGGLVVDAAHQGRGIGRATVVAVLRMFEGQGGYREAALTYAPDNDVARRLYAGLGFVETGEESEGELAARRPRAPVTE